MNSTTAIVIVLVSYSMVRPHDSWGWAGCNGESWSGCSDLDFQTFSYGAAVQILISKHFLQIWISKHFLILGDRSKISLLTCSYVLKCILEWLFRFGFPSIRHHCPFRYVLLLFSFFVCCYVILCNCMFMLCFFPKHSTPFRFSPSPPRHPASHDSAYLHEAAMKSPRNKGQSKSRAPEGVFTDIHRGFLVRSIGFDKSSHSFTGRHQFLFSLPDSGLSALVCWAPGHATKPPLLGGITCLTLLV